METLHNKKTVNFIQQNNSNEKIEDQLDLKLNQSLEKKRGN